MGTNRSVYSGPGRSEYIALEYLRQEYVQIRRNKDRTPDFICIREDGKTDRIEVKRLQSGIIYFTNKQATNMRDDDLVLVVDDEKVVGTFRWKDRDRVSWFVKIGRGEDMVELRVYLDQETLFKLKALRAELQCNTWKEFFRKVVERGKVLTDNGVIAY